MKGVGVKHWASLVVILMVTAASTSAQFWKKKNYSEWSERECQELFKLRVSPWIGSSSIGAWVEGETPAGPRLSYRATILSAWTIHWASIRLSQLREKGTQNSPTDDKAFVDQAYHDTVVFHVNYDGTPGSERASADFWKGNPKGHVAVVADGRRIESLEINTSLKGVELPNGFQAVFPRNVGGKPLLTPDMKEVYLEIGGPLGKARVRFEPKRMMVRGELVY